MATTALLALGRLCNDGRVTGWRREIEELHDVFQRYFLGTIDSLDRVEVALAPEFSIVGPTGVESSRRETMRALLAGHGHTAELVITITDPELLAETSDTIVARYVENHLLARRSNHRVTTVVFAKDAKAPNGVRWLRAHETWIT